MQGQDFRRPNGEYVDEKNNDLPGATEPVGDSGVHSYRTIDDLLSDALGIARVPSYDGLRVFAGRLYQADLANELASTLRALEAQRAVTWTDEERSD